MIFFNTPPPGAVIGFITWLRSRAATLVEFPAYQNDLSEVRGVLTKAGFDSDSISVRSMLDDIQRGENNRADVPWLVWRDGPPDRLQ